MTALSRVARAGRTVLFTFLPLALLLALTEAALWAADLGDPDSRLSLTRGFSAAADYIVPDEQRPGGWRTQMFGGESPEIRIPPKGARTRVLLLGESNTENFPGPYLEELLNAAAPEPGFEVINLGRRGYGSERVLILASQAMALQPDICLVYLGHNEFLERGFALQLATHWEQPWVADLAERFARLRTMNVLVTLFEKLKARGTPGAGLPEPQQYRVDTRAFDDFTWDQTLVFYDVYRRHCEALIHLAESHHARVLVSTLVGNDFDPPIVSNWPPTLDAAQQKRGWAVRGIALSLIPERCLPDLIQTRSDNPVVHLRQGDWGEGIADSELAARAADNTAANRTTLATQRPLLGPLAGTTLWANPLQCTPTVFTVLDTLSHVHAPSLTDDERLRLHRATQAYQKVLELAPDHPITHFELGLCQHMLGDDDQAARSLAASAHYDRAPNRCNDLVNTIIRDLAAAHPEIALLDAEQLWRARSPGGLIGYEVVMDNCHLQPGARRILMEDFTPALLELARR